MTEISRQFPGTNLTKKISQLKSAVIFFTTMSTMPARFAYYVSVVHPLLVEATELQELWGIPGVELTPQECGFSKRWPNFQVLMTAGVYAPLWIIGEK